MKSIVILISGRGSNMQAIVEAAIPGARIAAVISNRPDAGGLVYAAAHGIATEVLDHKNFATRGEFDVALAERIEAHQPDLVVLAGFMRILSADFVRRFEGRLINIHPSLLPAFPGLDTHARALAAGVRLHGTSVHFVTTELDCGPIIIQAAVPVCDDDDVEQLAARVLAAEHQIFPQAIRWLVDDRLRIDEQGRVRVLNAGASEPRQCWILPELGT